MKTLRVYINSSVFRFDNLFEDYCMDVDIQGCLRVSKITRKEMYEETECAVFNNWDYYLIEDEND